MDQETAKNINNTLALKYGSLHEKPRFRLVWANDLFEVREGEFKYDYEFGPYRLDLGTVHEKRLVPKYNYCQDRWVLEEIIFNKFIPKEIVSQEVVSYEPIWVFWTGDNGDYQEPDFYHVDQICYFRVNNTLKSHPLTEAQIAEAKILHDKRNVAKIRETIDEAIPDTAHAIVHGEGVAFGRGLKKTNEVLHSTQQSDDSNSNG